MGRAKSVGDEVFIDSNRDFRDPLLTNRRAVPARKMGDAGIRATNAPIKSKRAERKKATGAAMLLRVSDAVAAGREGPSEMPNCEQRVG